MDSFSGPGDAEGCLGAGETEHGVFALGRAGFGGNLLIAFNFTPSTCNLIIFRGLGPSELVELEVLSGARGRLSVFGGGAIAVLALEFEAVRWNRGGGTVKVGCGSGRIGKGLCFAFNFLRLPVFENLTLP